MKPLAPRLTVAFVVAAWIGSACSCGPKETLVFTSGPASLLAGAAQPPIVVEAQQQATTDRGASGKVTLSLTTWDGGVATISSGTLTQNLVSGVATFSDVVIAQAGTLVMHADGPNFSEGTSSPFVITAGPLSQLGIANAPSAAQAGEAFNPNVEVHFEDAFGNVVAANGLAVVSLDGGTAGAQLHGATEALADAGVAPMLGLFIDKIGNGYSLTATAPGSGLPDVSSPPFNVGVGPPRQLHFQTQPTTAAAGASISPAIQVDVTDGAGDVISDSTLPITLGIGVNPVNGTLLGTVIQSAIGGVATFSDLSIRKAASGYQLAASATNIEGDTSASFAILAGPPTQLGFLVPPGSQVITLAPIRPTVQVAVEDSFGNVAQSSAATVVMSLAQNQSPSGNLGGTSSQPAAAGVASFTDLKVTADGSNYTLTAAATSFPSITSNSFASVTRSFTYIEPSLGTGKIRIAQNPASTFYSMVLDVRAETTLTGYSVGFDLPLDATKVSLDAQGIVLPGSPPLNPGNSPAAMKAALPTAGPLQGVVVAGISQKAAGSGSVATDSTISTPDTTLFSVTLDLLGTTGTGVVFDGTDAGTLVSDPRFNAQMRDKLGNMVAGPADFSFGKLSVQ